MSAVLPRKTSVGRRSVAGAAAAALVVAQLALPPAAEANHVASASAGSVPPPSISVTQNFQPDVFTGRATMAIPLIVPPGRKGVQPNLALTYSSSARNGWVGVGWGLDLGSIEQSTKNGVPTYAAGAPLTLVMQGVAQELISVAGGYRAKDEGLFLRVEPNTGGAGWVVTDKSGTRYVFGQTSASRIDPSGKVFRWALESVVDPNGNSMSIAYTKDQEQLYPAQILYTAGPGLSPTQRIDFILETGTRPDVERSYRHGGDIPIVTAKRLLYVRMSTLIGGAWTLVRFYEFPYTTSARTGRSLLASITQAAPVGSRLPATRFTYQSQAPSQAITPVSETGLQLLADVDGNGFTDFITYSGGTWTVKCPPGATCTYTSGAMWLSGFGNDTHPLSSPLIADWNGDGLADVGYFTYGGVSGSFAFALSDGRGKFQTGMIPSASFSPTGYPLVGDFNGDGLPDVGIYSHGYWWVALNTGGSFTASAFWQSGVDTDGTPLTGDWNGDGLTDVGVLANQAIAVAYATGHAFRGSPTPVLTGLATTPTPADVNGDGLTDLAGYDWATGSVWSYPSMGAGFLPRQSAATARFTQYATDPGLSVTFGELNGDGLADPIIFKPTAVPELAVSTGSIPDLLSAIDNGVGGTTTIQYRSSATCNNVCPVENIPKLPFVLPLVQAVTLSDGMGGAYTTRYRYELGRYDGAAREFRGFGRVDVLDADNTVATTDFAQDACLKGHATHQEVKDAAGALWTRTEPTWTCQDLGSGIQFARLDQTDTITQDGDASARTVRSRFAYDAYGNVVTAYEEGEPGILGDERVTRTTFLYDTAAWRLSQPSLIQTLDAGGAVVAQRRFTYAGGVNLTKEEEWLAGPPERWLATVLTYDATGNVLTVTDALGRTTTNTYDAEALFLIKITNALGHSRQLTYDPRYGHVTFSTDQNGQTTQTMYDEFGHPFALVGPNDNVSFPTVQYTEDPCINTGFCRAPLMTTIRTRLQSGTPEALLSYAFTDGLGRTIQTRSPAQDPAQQVVTGAVEMNPKGQVVKQWAPYLDPASTTYRAPNAGALAPPVTYTYDPLGRLLTVTEPDGAVSSTAYDDGTVTVTDANGHRTRRTTDSAGRLATVDEVNGVDTATTTYQYDARNHLTQVTDYAGHVTRLTYDSLGRKVAMADPDMGVWTYAYDDVDNLTRQTDARGVATAFAYDALNRLTQKSYTVPAGSGIANPGPVIYTYEDPTQLYAKGQLTKVADGSGSSSFTYDNFGRLVTEAKTVDGTSYTLQRGYDLLGRLTRLAYPDGEAAIYSYDAQGGLASLQLGTQPIVTATRANAAGQLTQLRLGNGTVTDYAYDPQTLRLASLTTTGPGGKLQDFAYQYDPVGNLTALTDFAHTGSQTFAYDGLNRLTLAQGSYGRFTYAYDPLGNLIEKEGVTQTYGLPDGTKPHAVTSTSSGLTLRYDANGNLIEKRQGTAVVQTLAYDAENRLAEVVSTPETSVTCNLKAGWNFVSLPIVPADPSPASVFGSALSAVIQISRYDAATARFTHWVGNPKFDQFSSLQAGVGYQVYCQRAVSVTVKGRVAALPAQSLAAGWSLLPAQTTTAGTAPSVAFAGLAYDQLLRYDAGTQTLSSATTIEPGTAYYVHLSTASTWTPSALTTRTQFVYDGDGGRVKQVSDGKTTTFLGQSLEKAPDGTTTKYVFAGSQRIAAKDSTGKLRFYHGDHLGSTSVVTDAAGQLVELDEYTPFGSASRHDGIADVPQKFTGQRQDATHGLIFFPARAYDPSLGRFLQADPFIQDPSDPQTLNRYSYVRNNPVNLVDPSGYGWLRKFFAAVAAVFVAVVVFVATGGDCPGCAVAAGAATYAAIAGTGTSSTNTTSSSSPSTVSFPSTQSSATGVPEGSPSPAGQPLPGSAPARAPPPPWLRPLMQLGMRAAQRLANWDERTASVVEAAQFAQSSESTILLPGISPMGPRFVHQRADGSRYWSYSPQPAPGGEPSLLRKAAKSLTTYYNDPGRILRTTGRGLSEYGHPGFGRPMSITGLVLEPGGTGKLVGIAAGGTVGATLGRQLGIYIGGSTGGPLGGIVGSVGGGFIGGTVGGWFDPPYAGEPE